MSVSVAERVLNHARERIEATYDVHDYIAEKRAALEKWARYLQDLREDLNESSQTGIGTTVKQPESQRHGRVATPNFLLVLLLGAWSRQDTHRVPRPPPPTQWVALPADPPDTKIGFAAAVG